MRRCLLSAGSDCRRYFRHPPGRHEEEANEKRKKRFAREHDIEESKGRGITPVVQGMGDLAIMARRGGKKKFANLGYAVEEPEPMFDPVSRVSCRTSANLPSRAERLDPARAEHPL